jgi:hypothetical protein
MTLWADYHPREQAQLFSNWYLGCDKIFVVIVKNKPIFFQKIRALSMEKSPNSAVPL